MVASTDPVQTDGQRQPSHDAVCIVGENTTYSYSGYYSPLLANLVILFKFSNLSGTNNGYVFQLSSLSQYFIYGRVHTLSLKMLMQALRLPSPHSGLYTSV